MKNTSLLDRSVQYIRGVGPQRFKLLENLGIYSIEDLLYHFPRRYQDRRKICPISQLKAGEIQTISAKVLKSAIYRSKKRHLLIFQLTVGDKTGSINAVWFNQPYMKKLFKPGDSLILYGKIGVYSKLMMISPEYEIITDGETADPLQTARIVPTYPTTEDISQRFFRKIINQVLGNYSNSMSEVLSVDIRARNHLIGIKDAVNNIHFPANDLMLEFSKRRFVFDKFFFFS